MADNANHIPLPAPLVQEIVVYLQSRTYIEVVGLLDAVTAVVNPWNQERQRAYIKSQEGLKLDASAGLTPAPGNFKPADEDKDG